MIKINSKFSDYYDSAIGSFPDSEVVFNRTPKIETYRLSDFPSLGEDFDGNLYCKESYIKNCDPNHELGTYNPRTSDVYSFWVGFAGKWYSFTTLCETIGALVWSRYAKEVLDDPMKHWNSLFDPSWTIWTKPIDFDTLKLYSNYRLQFERNLGIKIPANILDRDFKNPAETEFWKDEAFDKFGPVFLAVFPVHSKYSNKEHKERIWIFKNPCLKTVEFHRAMDPYTALWNIDNWIDTHARPDDAIVPVGDDLTRLQAYGFDKKTSFRKSKEKK